jgi:hypothetical protein
MTKHDCNNLELKSFSYTLQGLEKYVLGFIKQKAKVKTPTMIHLYYARTFLEELRIKVSKNLAKGLHDYSLKIDELLYCKVSLQVNLCMYYMV